MDSSVFLVQRADECRPGRWRDVNDADDVSPRKQPHDDRSAEAAVAAELVRMAKEQSLALTGPEGLLKLFTKTVLGTALNEELTERFGLQRNLTSPERDNANVRNGSRRKTVLT